MVWVCTNRADQLGYHHDGIEIIIDSDTFRVGKTAPAMIVTPASGRWVLLSTEHEYIDSAQMIHMTGNVKLVEIPITESLVPNFWLSVSSVFDVTLFTSTKEIIIPPVEEYLTVEVSTDQEVYEPREDGTLTITTKDQDGKPVPAEVSIGLVDESVYYIQSDYAGDPRQFFFRGRRWLHVDTNSSFGERWYVHLVENPKQEGQLINQKHLVALLKQEEDEKQPGVAGDHSLFDGRASQSLFSGSGGGAFGGGMDMARRRSAGREMESFAAMPSMAPQEGISLGAPVETRAKGSNVHDLQIYNNAYEPDATGEQQPAVQVRTDFRSTVIWKPDVITDTNGTATVPVTYPDSLTKWKATARAATTGFQFGIATAATRTRKPLIARLQAPRFFVVGDEVTISAVLNNNTNKPMSVKTELDIDGGLKLNKNTTNESIEIPANSETRVDWIANVIDPGNVELKITARANKHADAMARSYTVYEHGITKFVTKAGKVSGDDVTIRIDIPAERKVESTTLEIQITPSLAVSMLDALPYLIEYPYGCTEQTLSRFVPAVVTMKTLRDLGLEPEDVANHMFGGVEQEHADKTHTKNKRTASLDQLDDVVATGLKRLMDMQHSSGAWGWWKKDTSDRFMTAYALWGLSLALEAGVEVDTASLNRAAKWLQKQIVEDENYGDRQAWLLHALAEYHRITGSKPSDHEKKALDNLYKNRNKLSTYSRALLAIAARDYGQKDKAQILIENLENGVKIDRSPDTSVITRGGAGQSHEAVIATAHWGEQRGWYRWHNGGIESTAFALKALIAIDPDNELIEPVLNWLSKNRRGNQWSNTRDTAIVVFAFNDYLRYQKEAIGTAEYEITANGKAIGTIDMSAESLLTEPNWFTLTPDQIADGINEIRFVRTAGDGPAAPIYFSVQAEYFTYEEPITPAGNEIFVRRDYYRLTPTETLLKGPVYQRFPLEDKGDIQSGDRVEVVLTIECKNDYEYLIFEDLKPAGFEAVQVRSGEALYAKQLKASGVKHKFGQGEPDRQIEHGSALRSMMLPWNGVRDRTDYTGRSAWVYQELRDRKVALFVRRLPEGVWEIRYDLRAEVPGKFHALPTLGHAMYVPEIRCNGAELRVNVIDR